MTTVRLVSTAADRRVFTDYPYKKYRDDPSWVPPLRISEAERLDFKKNPFFEHARVELYLAERGGTTVGRIAVIDDDLHNATHQDNLLFFGFFEAEDEEAARQLYAQLEKRAQDLGRVRVRGPVNPTMNDSAGFQINAFDTLPYLMMPQNPPEYPRWAKEAGFEKAKDLYAWRLRETDGLGERVSRLADRVRKRNTFELRPLNMRDFDAEVERVLTFYNRYWEDNWGHVKYTGTEARKLAADIKPIVDPNMILFMEMGGELAGMVVGLPDINQVFKRIPSGRLFPFGFWPLLRRRKHIDRIRLFILGLAPQFRNRGLELVMIDEFYKRGVARGYNEAECSWILEDNDAINKGIKATGAELYKTYRLYQKDFI